MAAPLRNVSRAAHLAQAAVLFVLLIVIGWVVLRGKPADEFRRPVILFYGYSTLEELFEERVLPAFQARWQEETGERVEFVTSFAASGLLVERILDRYPAEVAILSSELDARRLSPRIVARDAGRELPKGGTLARTPIVLLVRPGNPLNVRGFEDLGREDVNVLQCDPVTSGAGVWAVLAEYGAAWRQSGESEDGVAQLRAISENVTRWPPCAREMRELFQAGEGDVIVSYEQDLLRCASGSDAVGQIVVPVDTIDCRHIVLKIARNIKPGNRRRVDAFLEYLWSPACQEILRASGFESALDSEPTRGLFTLDDLGGAARARKRILEEAWRDGIRPTPRPKK